MQPDGRGMFMTDVSDALTGSDDGTIISLEISANSHTDLFPAGYNPWRKAIGCSVTMPPVEGKANKAIIALVAAFFKTPKNQVEILSGATSSQKRVLVRGLPKSRARLEIEQAL